MSQVRNPIILRTATRQDRPAAACPFGRVTGQVGQAALALVQAILARCHPFTPRWPGLSPIYRQEQPPVLAQYAQNYWQNLFAPHLKLTLVAAATPAPLHSNHPATPFTWQLLRPPVIAPANERLVLRLIQREQLETHALDDTIHRLMVRSQRIETITRQNRSPVQADVPVGKIVAAVPVFPASVLARPVPRVVHHPAISQKTGEVEPPAAAPSRWQPFTPVGSRPQPQSTLAETIDVNRLTEQIMHNIDRRLNAYRERTGRM
ncbi:MAG: hypothetical protein KJ063_17820 [Anaerolineae bacterium]|nr:hypothetical protein [Anaerolineae bacterium]